MTTTTLHAQGTSWIQTAAQHLRGWLQERNNRASVAHLSDEALRDIGLDPRHVRPTVNVVPRVTYFHI